MDKSQSISQWLLPNEILKFLYQLTQFFFCYVEKKHKSSTNDFLSVLAPPCSPLRLPKER